MVIKALIQKLTGEAKLQAIAENVAHSCAGIVWDKVSHRVHAMTTPQTQGYVRGRAGRTLKVQLQQAIVHNSIHENRHNRLMDMTMNQLISMMLGLPHGAALTAPTR